ncbi:uncharacterized protein LOC131934880 isoform X1 [Physella acuta]|uniref:uncharacterized protein LOC131934880 isoform X1 n=1 Tax=Physella acuta TaxID=109671 RepID=UPI0027DC3E10|nr:uncharacterized protein LOC131934880 isoform X1 [Physella acuta]
MPEQEINPAAAKFISSLVKSLQILCNGQVDFDESIELVGHINVRVDRKYKFDYIVDEHVSKEGEDSSTTFLSNSYHSRPPLKQLNKKPSASELEQEIMFSEIPHNTNRRLRQSKNSNNSVETHQQEENSAGADENNQNYSVSVEPMDRHGDQPNQMVVKLEEADDSNDCMVLPASPGDYEQVEGSEAFPIAGPSASYDESISVHTRRTRKRRKVNDLGDREDSNCSYLPVGVKELMSPNETTKECIGLRLQEKSSLPVVQPSGFLVQSNHHENVGDGTMSDKDAAFVMLMHSTSSKNIAKNESQIEGHPQTVTSSSSSNPLIDLKQLVAKLAALCDLPAVQEELINSRFIMGPSEDEIRSVKKKFFETVDKEKLKKIKEVLKMKKSKQRKQRLKSLLSELGISNDQLLLLAHTNIRRKKISWKTLPDGLNKEAMLKEHRKAIRIKTQERHQKLLEMAEMLKRNQVNDPGITVVSKSGGKKCILHKSSVSVVSHNTQQLSLENIDEVAEALTGKTRKAALVQQTCQDKSKEQIKVEYTRRICLKKKMKQIVGKMLGEISDAGYRVIVTSTVGSEAGSHSAELTVLPLKVDDFLPETKQSDVKPELTEEEYAKQLEREQILEKQKASEEKMKELEIKLLRILTGAEEIFVPSRKRYSPGEPRPTDAERMKDYRKKLKQDPEKYQLYRQKRVMSKRRHRLGEYAAKLRVNNTGASVTVIPAAPVNEEPHGQSMGGLVTMTQPVGGVSMHCPQVYEHPSSHQPTASVVNVHHSTQYVGQVSGIHPSHQHQPSITYGNEMDIVELIAATHNVQNQHFG